MRQLYNKPFSAKFYPFFLGNNLTLSSRIPKIDLVYYIIKELEKFFL